MRILVASDQLAGLDSRRAGQLIATGWHGADVTVVSVGDAGAGFAGAYPGAVSLGRAEPAVAAIPYGSSSVALGRLVAARLLPPPDRLVVDLAGGAAVHDGGAGLLAALGATADVSLTDGVAGLAGIGRVELGAARARVATTELIGVVPEVELSQLLTGLRGITSLRGRAADVAAETMLATDLALESFAELAGRAQARLPGAGACGGIGFAVLALGGRLSTGPALALAQARIPAGLDLVVTGCEAFDFASRGGGVVAEAARLAAAALCPCVVLAGQVLIGSREMRTMGVESAYGMRDPVGGAGESISSTPAELSTLAARVARSWSW